jgi:hypothetical protein
VHPDLFPGPGNLNCPASPTGLFFGMARINTGTLSGRPNCHPMPRYFFHLEGGREGCELIADKRGHVLPDDGAARREAQGIVEALRRRRGNAWCVIVANEWGHDVMEIPAALRAEG